MSTFKIKKNFEYRLVYKKGKSFSNKYLVLYVYRNGNINTDIRYGISVSKKVGKSVVRNRIRRLIFENFRSIKDDIVNGYELIFIARFDSKFCNYDNIAWSVKNLLERAGLFKIEKNINKNDINI